MGKFIDLTGQRFGRLTVLHRAENRNKKTYWHCLCDCGNEKDIAARHLSGGSINSCGCLNSEIASERFSKDFTGERFGSLIAIERIPNYKNGRTYYKCLCDCGNTSYVEATNLSSGHTTSCGCKSSRNGTKQYDFLHQYRFDSDEKIYYIYRHIAPNNKSYIGMTKQEPKRRWQSGEGYNTQRLFYHAIEKYGWDNFSHEILEDNLTHDEACEREQYYINYYKSNQEEYGYNVTSGGDGCRDRGKQVVQIYNNEIVNVFSSIKEASEKLQMSHGAIGNYVRDGKMHGGYFLKQITYEEYLLIKNIANNKHLKLFRQAVLNEKSEKTITRNKSCSIPISQYSLDGTYMHTYKSVNCAMKETNIKNISYALKHKGSQAGGYLWKYDDGDYSNIEPYKDKKHNAKSVQKIDKENMIVLSTYKSLIEAEKDTGISFKQIWKACNGQRKTVGGYIWRYVDEKGE